MKIFLLYFFAFSPHIEGGYLHYVPYPPPHPAPPPSLPAPRPQEESKKEAIDEATKQSNPDPVTAAETSFNEADEESWEPEPTNSTESAARPSFADILVAPKYDIRSTMVPFQYLYLEQGSQ